MNRELTLQFEHMSPMVIVHVGGFLAQFEVYRFKSELDAILDEGYQHIVLDLTPIDFIDSAGIGSLLQLRKRCQGRGANVCLVRPERPQVRQTLLSASLDKIIPFYENLESARAKIAGQVSLMTQDVGLTSPGLDHATASPAVRSASSAGMPSTAELFALLDELRTRSERIEKRLEKIEGLLESAAVSSTGC